MIEMHILLSFFGLICPFILLIAFLCLFQIWKDRYWDTGIFQESLKKRLSRYYKNYISFESYQKVVRYFSREDSVVLVRKNLIVQPCRYAVRPVSYDVFRDFVVSGKATLHKLEETSISDSLQIEGQKNIQDAVIGICRTKHSGLVFYPATKKDYKKVISFLRQRKKHIEKELTLIDDIKKLEKRQQYNGENNERMQQFIKEFAEENCSNEDIPSPSLESEEEGYNSFNIPKPELKL